METTDNLTLENYTQVTGRRFRVSRDQKARIEAGTLTREGAFQEFLAQGGPETVEKRTRPDIPLSVYLEEGLTIDNFAERVESAIGVRRRFRVSREQSVRIDNGDLTREGALQEVIEQKRREANDNE